MITVSEALKSDDNLAIRWSDNNDPVLLQCTVGSNKKALWLCPTCKQSSFAPIWKQVKKPTRCAVCSGQRVVAGVNDLAFLNPVLAEEWDEKNIKSPAEVTLHSSYKASWRCAKGHQWLASVSERARGTNCPECQKQEPVRHDVDILPDGENVPQLMTNWYVPGQKNRITSNSKKTCSWQCYQGHFFLTSPYWLKKHAKCPVCELEQKSLAVTHPHLEAEWNAAANEKPFNLVTSGSSYNAHWMCGAGHTWVAVVYSRAGKSSAGCPYCGLTQSIPEKELLAYIEDLFPDTLSNTRQIIPPYEVDIYVPEKKVGIEFNGVYWHSEAGGKTRTYHQDKYEAAKAAGIQLIQVWEDDYNRDPELVKRILAHKLGVNPQPVVYARKTRVEGLTTAVARAFMDGNHIQGFASGSYYLGLRDIESRELVAVMVLKKEPGKPGTLNIVRYATSTRVPGGFTKLLKYAENTYNPSRFITFADHCISDGRLYEGNGFVADKELPPDYMYLVGNRRVHKFSYRIKKFRNDPNLKFVEGFTERELADLNTLHRVWDAGKTRYVKKV